MVNQIEQINLQDISDRASVFSNIMNWDLEKLKLAKFMVIGAGALGNEVLKNLALLGVQHILVADFDVIEPTNLAKSVLYRESDCTGTKLKVDVACQRIKEISPLTKVMTINGDATIDIGLGIFRQMDAIICCVDNRLTRLWVNRFCHWLDKPWIDGGIVDLGGQATVFYPGISCYESSLSPSAWVDIQFRNGCLNRAKRYSSAGIANTTPITASIVGAVQVQEALKIVFGTEPKWLIAGNQFYYEGLSNTYELLPYNTIKDQSKSKQRYTDIEEVTSLSNTMPVGEVIKYLVERFEDPDLVIALHYRLILEIATEQSDQVISWVKPRPHITPADLSRFQQIQGEDVRITKHTQEIDVNFPYPELSLQDIGIPPLHILEVVSKGKQFFIELSGDQPYLQFV